MTALELATGQRRKAEAKRRRFHRHERLTVGVLSVSAFLVVWQLSVSLGGLDPIFVSSPLRIIAVAREAIDDPEFWRDVKVSSVEFLYGYLAAIAAGVPLGLLIGMSRRLRYMFGPIIDMMNAVPRVTFLPILVLWFGIGLWSKFAVVFLGAIIPIVISTFSGVRTNEARFIKVALSFSASRMKIFTSIILPGTAPFIFTGLRYASGRALLGVVVGELYAATAGVGHMIAEAGNTFQTDTVFFGVLLFTITGMTISAILDKIERRFDRWRPPAGGAR
jgi:ABC-type nitrate/sulfonate/bicarbonate transport system permease component